MRHFYYYTDIGFRFVKLQNWLMGTSVQNYNIQLHTHYTPNTGTHFVSLSVILKRCFYCVRSEVIRKRKSIQRAHMQHKRLRPWWDWRFQIKSKIPTHKFNEEKKCKMYRAQYTNVCSRFVICYE